MALAATECCWLESPRSLPLMLLPRSSGWNRTQVANTKGSERKPGQLGQRGIGWLVNRSHVLLNVWLKSLEYFSTTNAGKSAMLDGMDGHISEVDLWINKASITGR